MISEVRKQLWCPSAGSKTQDAKITWCLLERAGGSYDDWYAGALAEMRLESQASPLDFILRSVEPMQYLEWEDDVISHVENKLFGAWTWTHTHIIFLLLRSELKNSEKKNSGLFNLVHTRSYFEGRMAFI